MLGNSYGPRFKSGSAHYTNVASIDRRDNITSFLIEVTRDYIIDYTDAPSFGLFWGTELDMILFCQNKVLH